MATHSTDPPAFVGFEGFDEPGFTQVPDIILDHLLHLLTGAQLKVLLYIVRKTYGFRKQSDSISLSQLMHGIKRRDGIIQDHGTGLTKKTLLEALSWLEAEGYIVRQRQDSPERGNEPTAYCLRMRGDGAVREKTTPPLGEKLHQGVGGIFPPSPWRKNSPTQETLEQETTISKQRARSETSTTTGDISKFRKGSRPKIDGESRGKTPPLNTDPTASGPGLSRIGAVLEARGLHVSRNAAAVDHGSELPGVTNAHLAQPARAASTLDQPIPQGRAGRRRQVPVSAPSSPEEPLTRSSADTPQQHGGAPTSVSSTVVSDDEREALARYLGDFAPELGDTAKFTSTLTWTCNTYARSGLTLSAFIQRLYSARSRTKEAKSASHIRGRPFPFFKALVEEECGLREPPPEIAAAAKAQLEHQAVSTTQQPSQDRPSLAGRYARMVHR